MKHTEVSNFLNFLTKNPNKISEFEKLRNKYPKGKLDEKKSEEFLSQDLIPFAKENGFNFTKEEYKKFTEKVYDENKQEINLETLEDVSGGLFGKTGLKIGAVIALATTAFPAGAALVTELSTPNPIYVTWLKRFFEFKL